MDIQITEETKAYLASLAAMKHTSPEALAAQMLEEQARRIAVFEHEKTEDMETLEAMKNGQYIDHDTMMNWVESWGTDNELPCPKPTK